MYTYPCVPDISIKIKNIIVIPESSLGYFPVNFLIHLLPEKTTVFIFFFFPLENSFVSSRMSYERNHTVCAKLFHSAYIWDSSVLLDVSVVYSFLLVNEISLYEHTIVCLPIILLIEIQTISRFRLLRIRMLRTLLKKFVLRTYAFISFLLY